MVHKEDLLFWEVVVTPGTVTEYSHSVVHNVHTNQGPQCSSVPTYTLVVHNVALYWLGGDNSKIRRWSYRLTGTRLKNVSDMFFSPGNNYVWMFNNCLMSFLLRASHTLRDWVGVSLQMGRSMDATKCITSISSIGIESGGCRGALSPPQSYPLDAEGPFQYKNNFLECTPTPVSQSIKIFLVECVSRP